MGTEDQKVVWILGAGFSVPLGGPPFKDLISPETLKALRTWGDYAAQKWMAKTIQQRHSLEPSAVEVTAVEAASFIQRLYEQGRQGPLKLWSDAEQFLDRLGIAATEPGQLARDIVAMLDHLGLKQHGGEFLHIHHTFAGDLRVLQREAVRFVAGACSTFLLRPQDDSKVVDESEQWDPYRRWPRHMKGGLDSVVTFNYDRALDIIAEHQKRKQHVHGILCSPAGMDPDDVRAQAPHTVPVYHLHGHVGWKTDGKSIITQAPNLPIAHADPDHAVIGVPGEHKRTLPMKLLLNLWNDAMSAIEKAQAVVFIGYRFPPTDNYAKRKLLNALRHNPEAIVHTVLGAKSDDTPRLKGMIEWTRDKVANPVRVHDMWAEDFFSAFEREGLFQH